VGRSYWIGTVVPGALAAVLGGCATRDDLLQHERAMEAMIERQNDSIEAVTKDIERLRLSLGQRSAKPAASRPRQPTTARRNKTPSAPAAGASGGGPAPPPVGSGEIGMTPAPEGGSSESTPPEP